MQSPDDPLPLGHDGYLKLWALSDPVILADYILMDEAQDTNPVVLGVLQRQPAQMIYVGDKHQSTNGAAPRCLDCRSLDEQQLN